MFHLNKKSLYKRKYFLYELLLHTTLITQVWPATTTEKFNILEGFSPHIVL